MAKSSQRTVELLEAQLRASERLNRVSKDTGKELDGWHLEMQSLLKDSANLEHSMKRVQQLQKARIGAGASRSGTAEYVRQCTKEYELLLKTLNTGQHQGKNVEHVTKLLAEMHEGLKKIEGQSDSAWDKNNQGLEDANALLEKAGRNVDKFRESLKKVHIDKMSTSFKKMGQEMNNAFDGQLGRMMRRIPGVQGFQDTMRVGHQAKAAQANLRGLTVQRASARHQASQASAQEVADKFGAPGMRAYRKMGFAGESPLASRTLHRAPAALKEALTPNVSAKAGGTIEQMTVKNLTAELLVTNKGGSGKAVGNLSAQERRDQKRAAKATSEAMADATVEGAEAGRKKITLPGGLKNRSKWNLASANPADVQGSLGSGALGKGFNRLAGGQIGKGGMFQDLAKGLISKGGGSAAAGLSESLVGAGSGVASMGMGVISKVAPILAVGKGLMDVYDKIVTENKNIQENLGGAGIHGAGAEGVGFHNIRKTLLSTGMGNAAMMGQGQKENLDIMKSISESGGLAVGKTLRSGKLNLGESLSSQEGEGGKGFYGSMMKNAVYNGKNIGMGSDASVRLTMKLMEKFGKTTGATQDFFQNMDTMMESSGVSASKYIDIIDSVTDQFSDMNKSLGGTLAILNNLGKSGRLTGKAMEDMVKTLQSQNQMSTEQRMFNAQQMVAQGGNHALAAQLESQATNDEEEQRASLKAKGISDLDLKDITGNREKISLQLSNSGMDSETLKTTLQSMNDAISRIGNARGAAQAFRSGKAENIASAVGMYGESAPVAMATKQANMRFVAESSGLSKRQTEGFAQGDEKIIQEILNGPNALLFQQMNQRGVTTGSGDALAESRALGGYKSAGALNAMQFGQGSSSAAGLLDDKGKTPEQARTDREKYTSMLRLQNAREGAGLTSGKNEKGEALTDEEKVQKFIEMSKGPEQDKLQLELKGLGETVNQMSDSNSAMTKALKDTANAIAATAKAKEITSQTRTMADTFADAFSYLFDKIVNLLDELVKLNPLRAFKGKPIADRADYKADREVLDKALAGISGKNLSEGDQAWATQVENNKKSGYYQLNDAGREQLTKDTERAQKLNEHFNPNAPKLLDNEIGGRNRFSTRGIKTVDPKAYEGGVEEMLNTLDYSGVAKGLLAGAGQGSRDDQYAALTEELNKLVESGDLESHNGTFAGKTSVGAGILSAVLNQDKTGLVGASNSKTIINQYSAAASSSPVLMRGTAGQSLPARNYTQLTDNRLPSQIE